VRPIGIVKADSKGREILGDFQKVRLSSDGKQARHYVGNNSCVSWGTSNALKKKTNVGKREMTWIKSFWQPETAVSTYQGSWWGDL